MTERPAAPAGYSWHDIELPGSRRLEVLSGGPENGFPLVFHSGTPSGAAALPLLVEPAAERGLRTITYSRPGYGTSTAARGRTVADAAADTAAVLGSLGYGEDSAFVTVGWSGGGPHALACAALLADRCRGTAVIAGVAPFDGEGLDWSAGMAAENLMEFDVARAGGEEFEAFLSFASEMMAAVTDPSTVAEALGGLVTEHDKEALRVSGLAEYMIAGLQQAILVGTAGWRDDDAAFMSPWGFRPGDIHQGVSIWQGSEDRMVPVAHGRWLAANIASSQLEIAEGEGHLSTVPIAVPHILDDLVAAGPGR